MVGGGYGFLADFWACRGNSSGRRNVGDSAGAAMWGGLIKGVSSSSTTMGCRKLILVSHTTPSQTRGFRSPHGSPRQPPSLVFPKGSGRGFSLLLRPHDPSFFGLWPHLSSSWLHFHRALSPVSPQVELPSACFLQGHLSLGSWSSLNLGSLHLKNPELVSSADLATSFSPIPRGVQPL